MSAVVKGKRDRVAKACATCRKKKIKCNGEQPCAHCLNIKIPCEYPSNKPRKSRTKALLDVITNRLDRLESLMQQIADRVGGLDSRNVPYPGSVDRNLADSSSTTSSSPALELSLQETDTGKSNDNDSNNNASNEPKAIKGTHSSLLKSGKAFFERTRSILSKNFQGDCDNCNLGHQMLHYKGLHLGIVFIFSTQSIEWIKSRLKPEDHKIVIPFRTILYYFMAWNRLFLSVWTEMKLYPEDDVKKLKEGIYPHDKQLTFELLQQYHSVVLADFVLDAVEAKELFVKFYANKGAPKKKKYKFLNSELMAMSLILCISITVVIDQRVTDLRPSGKFSKLDAMPIEQLIALQEEMFLNSVYYFHTISVVSEGMATVQALLLLVVHLETTWVVTEMNYSFVSMALRYAQELGLHRFETFQHLPQPDIQKRSRLWAAVLCFDVEMSHRTGKPPLVNIVDVSTLTPADPWYVPQLMSQADIEKFYQLCGHLRFSFDEVYVRFFLYKLSRIRAFTYFQLFSATVKYDSLKGVQDIVTSLNGELKNISNELKEEFRPRFYFEPEFALMLARFSGDERMSSVNDGILSLQLAYFFQLMTINKVPSQLDPNQGNTPPHENSQYRKLALDSARTILHLIRGINRKSVSFFAMNWIITCPFFAMMNLIANCLNYSDDSEGVTDLNLLIDLSMNFFNHYTDLAKKPSTGAFYLRLHLFGIIIRIALRITVKVYEENNNVDILGSNPQLKSHLEQVEKEFPQFYTEVNAPSDLLSLLTCMHPYTDMQSDDRKFTPNGSLDTSSSVSNQDIASLTFQHASGIEAPSPKKNDPTLSNILHPVDFASARDSERKDFNIDDDLLLAAINQDFLALPNFFFDNGL